MDTMRMRAMGVLWIGVIASACATGAEDPESGPWGSGGEAGAGSSPASNASGAAGCEVEGVEGVDGGGEATSDASAADALASDSSSGDAAGDVVADVTADGPVVDATDGSTPTGLPPCGAAATVDGPLVTTAALDAYGSYAPGPLMLHDEHAYVFLEGSSMWMVASHGAATTGTVPNEIEGATRLSAWSTMTGWNGVTFEKADKVYATKFDGTSFTAPVETPCTSGGSACVPRVAGDGHLWIQTSGSFYEQVPSGFESRGGAPVSSSRWDVDAQGTVIVLGSGDSSAGEKLTVWKLPAGAGGWTKAGAFNATDVAGVDAAIEGGFKFGTAGYGAMAPDGSLHLFSDPRCVGTGDHNKVQAYLHSQDGVTWTVETLPSANDLTGGLLTWRHAAFWAGDDGRVGFVFVSSPEPTFDGWEWQYPSRRYDVVMRCEDAQGQATFERVASVTHPGWTTPGFAGFSEEGWLRF